ncbi:MAG: type II secretion system F family protein [Deltaproteobacteria bacterium]|nr:type II secretion system F family protein [Deltaproteobacteria bacterium]MBW2546742.1 type II secretion system F family protein [Deltaproteobacteria bacterium]
MAEWVYEARTRAGEVQTGIIEADSKEAVQSRLRARQLNPLKIKKKGRQLKLSFGTGVTPKELVVFTRQFATMIDAGLPLVQCLDILSSRGDNKALNAILKDVKDHVEQGGTFSEGLGKHPKLFDELFVNLVRAGEMGGILDTILNRLAGYIEKRVKLARQVRGAMVYPVAIFFVAIIVVVVMLAWVIPSFKTMFSEFGGEDGLPALTQLVITASEGFLNNVHWIILGTGAFVFTITWIYRQPVGKHFFHRTLLVLPILGPVMRKISVARFTRTLGTLLSAGVPILDALDVVKKSAGNVVVEMAIQETSNKIREGRTMAEPLMETNVFPPMVVQMIGVGEQTGALDTMLNKIADFYEDEVDIAVAALTSLLEPLMMVFIGGIVGTILIAMYLPIFSIAGKVNAE